MQKTARQLGRNANVGDFALADVRAFAVKLTKIYKG